MEEIYSFEKICRGKKFIINENTKSISSIRLFIRQNCQHHQHMKMFMDDGHTYGYHYKCTICFEDLGIHIPNDFDPALCEEIDRQNKLCTKLSAEMKTCTDFVTEIENQIYLLQKKFADEICTHANTYEISYADGFKYNRCTQCETLIK